MKPVFLICTVLFAPKKWMCHQRCAARQVSGEKAKYMLKMEATKYKMRDNKKISDNKHWLWIVTYNPFWEIQNKKVFDKWVKSCYYINCVLEITYAEVLELADRHDSGSCSGNRVRVQVPSSALSWMIRFYGNFPRTLLFSSVRGILYHITTFIRFK